MNKNSGNIFKFQGKNMIVHAKGPNINKNLRSKFNSNLLSSTMNLPRNFERQGYGELSSQRSMFYGRELSPTASVRSDFQPRNFHQPFSQGSDQSSTYRGRGGSPVSMRSIDSTASVATDIAHGIKNGNFNKHEWRIILQAINTKRKHNFRRHCKKRRKIKLYFQNTRNGSGDDSGEQGSNSSMSSDDCMSTRTGYSSRPNRNYKENVPQNILSLDSRSIDTNFGKDRDTRHPAGYAMEKLSRRDPENMTSVHNNPNNIFHSQGNTVSDRRNVISSQIYMNNEENVFSSQINTNNTSGYSNKSLQNSTVKLQKDRFKNGFQFSSQRFNNSLMPIEELKRNKNFKTLNKNSNNNKETQRSKDDSSEDDNIFLDTTTKPSAVAQMQTKHKNNTRQKRNVDYLDDVAVSAEKKLKTTINNNKAGQKTKNINENNDFVFAKPQFPIRKKPIEKLISKSTEPYLNIPVNVQEDNTCMQAVDAPSQERGEYKPAETTQDNSDVSMRPSFMKRKLFTQTLDITEKKNNSSESLSTDSPQNNIYSALLLKEKHKTRKLATSQSLLSRDVSQDDNNLLDLIHKIMPPSQVNTANIVKPSHTKANENKTASDGNDKWDITSILSSCNNDSVSDTYTDDEIFKVANDVKSNNTNKCKEKDNHNQIDANSEKKKTIDKHEINKGAMAKCNVIVHKLPLAKIPRTQIKSPALASAGHAKKVTLSNSRIDAFWNTDAESDYECPPTPHALKEKYFHGTSNNDNIATPKQSNIKSYNEVRKNISTNKISKKTITQKSSLIVNKNDTTLVKALKKQTNRKITNTSNTKTLHNTHYKEVQPEKTDKKEKNLKANMMKPRRQTKNQSAIEESCSSKDDFAATEPHSKQSHSHTKKSKEKNTKSQCAPESAKRNGHSNNIQSQTGIAKKTKLQKNANHLLQAKIKDDVEDIQNGTICKVLRSRAIDISSSFNSDKFELTGLSCLRKSRTPSKRISFNKSKNGTVKKGSKKLNAK